MMIFSKSSPWNTVIKAPQFTDLAIGPSPKGYKPWVRSDSLPLLRQFALNGALTVYGIDSRGVWDQTAMRWAPYIQLEHIHPFTPTPTSDGWACVLIGAKVWSFWQLKFDADRRCYVCQSVAYTVTSSSGFGTTKTPYAGIRATGASLLGGLLLTEDCQSPAETFPYKMAMTIPTYAAKKGFVSPAQAEDWNADTAYKGNIPLGSTFMLPPDFPIARITTPGLVKIAKTFMQRGGIAVDTNDDTPWTLVSEAGSGFEFPWQYQNETDLITQYLRVVK